MKTTGGRRYSGVAVLLLSIVVATAARPVFDPDFWWHLRTGKLIAEQGIPSSDPYSFTVPGKEWITHEWLSEVIIWQLYSSFGNSLNVLIVFFALVTTGSFLAVYNAAATRAVPTAFVTAFAACACALVLGVRPQMFNLAGIAITVAMLERHRIGRQSDRSLWLLVPVTLVWANLHSGYLLAIAVIGVYAVGDVIELRRRCAARLAMVGAACFGVAAINPSGVALWRYPFDTLRSPVMRDFIAEWAAPDFHDTGVLPFLAFLIVAVVSVVASQERLVAAHGLLLFGTGVAALQSMRHISVFAIVSVVALTPHFESALDQGRARWSLGRPPRRERPPAPLFFHVGLSALAAFAVAMFVSAAIAANDEVIADEVPVAAVDFLETSGLANQPGLNQYRFGGYLIWRDIPVFIDGRADVYGDEFLRRYIKTHAATLEWRDALDDFDVEWAMIAPRHRMATVLVADPGWELAFESEVADVYVRAEAAAQTVTSEPSSLLPFSSE